MRMGVGGGGFGGSREGVQIGDARETVSFSYRIMMNYFYKWMYSLVECNIVYAKNSQLHPNHPSRTKEAPSLPASREHTWYYIPRRRRKKRQNSGCRWRHSDAEDPPPPM